MTEKHKQLLFSDVDELAYSALRGKFEKTRLPATYLPRRLGPLLELLQLSQGGRIAHLRDWFTLNGAAPLVAAIELDRESWTAPQVHHAGYIRAVRSAFDGDSRMTGFLMTAKRVGHDISGLPTAIAGQLTAAMVELENNIHEHSDAPDSGIIAYRAEPGVFEFVVADRGIGILSSLRRCATFSTLTDDGKALELALTDGVSRHGLNTRHGHGFRPIFTGLVNLHGELRFRSGDHAVTMNGTNPNLVTARVTQKAPIDGFFASVRCHLRAQQPNEGRRRS